MSTVLLINPSFENPKRNHSLFPFGIAYIAAYLQKYGHDVEIWDIFIESEIYADVKEKIDSGFLNKYDHIGITGIVTQYLYIKKLVRDIKQQSNVVVTVGGPLATYSYKFVLKNTEADICCIGQGEYTYREIVENASSINRINGISFVTNDNTITITQQREPFDNISISSIPRPAYELFDMEHYVNHTGMMDVVRSDFKDERVMPFITARGCPYNCNFCSKSIKKVAIRPIDEIFAEIKHVIERYNVETIRFIDELFVLSKKRTRTLCKKLNELDVKWDAQARVNLVDKELLLLMKESGCVCIGFGIESGSKTILDRMNKQITPEHIFNALTWCREIRLPVKIQLIYGYPGENEESLAETIELFKKLRYPARRFSIITPLPGACLYETAKQDGFIGDSIDDQISEEDFIKFICNYGMCNQSLFYNRTSFEDEEFISKLVETEEKLIRNFFIQMLLHPLFFAKYWNVYRHYIRGWWKVRYKFRSYRIIRDIFSMVLHPYVMAKRLLMLWQKDYRLFENKK